MTSDRHAEIRAHRAAMTPDIDEPSEHARRRAARWHRWLKSPQCTLQDRENFERWCSDATNAAAYVALCGDLAVGPELAEAGDEASFDGGGHVFTPAVRLSRLEADPR
jgi:hypothetical protein